MKKAILIALCLTCVISLAGCGDTADKGDTTKNGVIGDGLEGDAERMKDKVEEDASDLKDDIETGTDELKDDVTGKNTPDGNTTYGDVDGNKAETNTGMADNDLKR